MPYSLYLVTSAASSWNAIPNARAAASVRSEYSE